MNRQRRQEAIARRRALIDSHIQMLSNTTRVVPNIIRNRAGGRPQPPKYAQPVEYVENKPAVASSRISQGNLEDPLANLVFKLDGSNSTEQVYLTVVNDGDGSNTLKLEDGVVGQEPTQSNQHVPFALSDEIARMFNGSGKELIQSLQTIETEDGTVMVVLEGNNFSENDIEGSHEVTSHLPNSRGTAADVFFSGLSTTTRSEMNEIKNEVAMMETEMEESYVIVQTADGDVLVPSKLCSQAETPSPPPVSKPISSEESIVQFIANESGAIEQLISNSNKSRAFLNKRKSKVDNGSNQNVGKRTKSMQNVPAVPLTSNKNFSGKIVKTSTSFLGASLKKSILPRRCESLPAKGPRLNEEKPRPYRFELPELENVDDCFLSCSVPVPIMIDNLRSENKPRKARKEKPQVVSNSTANSCREESASGPINDANPDVVEISQLPGVSDLGVTVESESTHEVHHDINHLTKDQCSDEITDNQNGDDNSSSMMQCGHCMELFPGESSVISHLESCKSRINDNDSMNQDLHPSQSSTNDMKGLIEEEESIVIKSVNSLNVPPVSTPIAINSDVNVKISSHRHETISNTYCDSAVENEHFMSTSNNEEVTSICVQLVEEVDEQEQLPKERTNFSIETVTYIDVNEEQKQNEVEVQHLTEDNYDGVSDSSRPQDILDIGRRTLNKASAKANMSNELVETEVWGGDGDSTYSDKVVMAIDKQHTDGNGNTITIQSARIRSRNDRTKALDENMTNEEEMRNNFRNIYEQVVKHSVAFN